MTRLICFCAILALTAGCGGTVNTYSSNVISSWDYDLSYNLEEISCSGTSNKKFSCTCNEGATKLKNQSCKPEENDGDCVKRILLESC